MTVTRKPKIVFHRRPRAIRRSADFRIPPSERGRSRFEVHKLNMEVSAALGLEGFSARWWVRMKMRALGVYRGEQAGRIFVFSAIE